MVESGSLQMLLESIFDLDVRVYLASRGVRLFDPVILWDTTRMLCLYEGVLVTSHIG